MNTTDEWNTLQSLLKQQDYYRSIVLLEEALSENPRHPIYLYWLAYSFVHINHPLAALEVLEQYCTFHPQDIDLTIQSILLIANFDATKFHVAENIASEGIQNHPQKAIFYRYMGFLKARIHWQEAAPFFEKAYQLEPTKNPIPPPPPEPKIFKQAVSWLPSSAQDWIQTLIIKFETSPTIEILNVEEFPHHPLIPFLLYNDTAHIFLVNLRYQPKHKSASTAIFEQLLELWNDYESNNRTD